jgi:activating signal cointegrator complex subunit 2
LYKTIEATVLDILALPLQHQCSPATLTFVASFARDAAVQTLRSLSDDQRYVIEDQVIRERMLFLLDNLASSSLGLDLQTFFDLSIVYCRTRPKHMRTIVSTSLKMNPSLLVTFESEALPDLTSLLASPETPTLDRLRKVSHCILSILRVFSIEFVRLLCYHAPFVCALASAYDAGLASAAQAHGGTHLLVQEVLSPEREVQGWKRIYLETKVALIDAFHILLGTALKEASTSVAECEQVFKLIFALLEVPSSSSSSPSSASSPQTSVPFINRTLLEDYEHAYTLSDTLRVSLGRATDQDARIDLLSSMLGSFSQSHASGGRNDPGGLKFLLQSSNNGGERPRVPSPGKGKAKASTPPFKPLDHDLTQKITQVQEILPDYPPEYIRALLVHPGYSFRGDAEKVIEALLEGTAPPQDEIQFPAGEGEDEFAYTKDRNNVWDSEPMELSQVQLGKRRSVYLSWAYVRAGIDHIQSNRGDQAIALHDLALNERMKADILRRVEAMSDEDEEFEFSGSGGLTTKSKPVTLAYEDELDLDAAVKVVGDGEGSSSSDEGNDSDEGGAGTPSPETILELAYIQDPQLFARDAVTRRGQARADLKSRTGVFTRALLGTPIAELSPLASQVGQMSKSKDGK